VCPSSAGGNALPSAAQEAAGCLCHADMLLPHLSFAAYQTPRELLCKAASHTVILQPVMVYLLIPHLSYLIFLQLH